MTSVVPPICGGCVHLRRSDPRPLLDPRCEAFPAGIPDDILLSRVDHRQPVEGDNGIRFEPQDDRAADYAAGMFEA